MLSAPDEKRVLDLIKGKDSRRVKATLSEYSQEDREKVSEVIIDRCRFYKNVAWEVSPNALVIPDKFHLIAEVTRALDKVRKQVQKEAAEKGRKSIWGIRALLTKNAENLSEEENQRLWSVLNGESKLKTAYLLTDKFRKALGGNFSDFLRWELSVKYCIFEEFRKLARSPWHKDIKNYYRRNSFTNGFAEGINNKIKVIKRRAYGLRNDENFRERILAACG